MRWQIIRQRLRECPVLSCNHLAGLAGVGGNSRPEIIGYDKDCPFAEAGPVPGVSLGATGGADALSSFEIWPLESSDP